MPKSLSSYVKCKNCKKTDVKFSSEENKAACPYLKKVTCQKCGNNWFCCTFHQIKISGHNVKEAMMHFDSESHETTKRLKTSNDKGKACAPSLTNLDEINNAYFQRESMEEGNGIKYIVARAFASNDVAIPDVTIEEARFHVKLAKFFSEISESKQLELVDLLNSCVAVNFKTTSLPSNLLDVHKVYTSNKQSILRNVPQCSVKTKHNHACVSLKETVGLFIARGLKYANLMDENFHEKNDFFNKNQHAALVDSLKLKFSHVPKNVVCLLHWSDGFIVNSSKNKGHSVWIKTVSFLAHKGDDKIDTHTSLLAIGMKSSDHDPIN